jgi:pyruvate/2-oxoglutarate dehydrogenase complex dihydrolipoamide acyltransferase (E2) component/uncharacterized OsmC-like protein
MPVVIQMPKLGHTMTEGTVIRWHKREGEPVREGELVLTVETDKAEVEVEAPAAGVLAKIMAADGVVVAVGGALAVIARNGESLVAAAAAASPVNAAGAPQASAAPGPPLTTTAGSAPPRRVAASPRARRLAAQHGVDLASVAGSGLDGMITEDDVRRAHERSSGARPAATTVAYAAAAQLAPARREKLTRIQQAGARNLVASWQNVPHFVQMARIDMSRALAARHALAASGARITITDALLAAAVQALKENPRINASYSDGEMLIYDRINLGVAVDTPDGLVVPVIHDAGALDLAALSARRSELASRARDKKLTPDDLSGATFTVSNLGAYGVENGTPVIFAPQAALMFVGAIGDEVLAIDGRPEVRPALHIAIAYDHRGIDGATASRFTTRVKELLEGAAFLSAAAGQGAIAQTAAQPARRRDVTIESDGDSLRTRAEQGAFRWTLDADDAAGPDPVTAFLGALGSCLLMSLRVAARARKVALGRASARARANEKGHVKEIQVELEVETELDGGELHKLVAVAERGCHIRVMLRDDIAFSLKVERIAG